MRISQEGIRLVKAFEGLRLHAYEDIAGIITIGYGHTGHDVHAGLTISEEDAEVLLRIDIVRFEECVTDAVEVLLSQHEFDACVSLAYNIGCKAFAASTLLKLLNAGNKKAAADQFLRWDKARGKVVAGLTKRRQAERELFHA